MIRVLLTGGNGMLGRALRAQAASRPDITLVAPARAEVDLADRAAVDRLFAQGNFDTVIHAAAKVGGIQANIRFPADFYTENTLLNVHVIDGAMRAGVKSFLNIGSSCMYPRNFEHALKEGDILTAPLEPTNEGYAIAKVAAARHCDYIAQQHGLAYRTLIPCNLYGPYDDFSPERSHLVAAIVAKVVEAKRKGLDEVSIWGDGTVRREFLFVEDLAQFVLHLVGRESELPNCLNLGLGHDYTVNEYYAAVAEAVGYTGRFVHELDRPVGMKRKLLDVSAAQALGWRVKTPLNEGIARVVTHYQEMFPA